MSYFGSAFTNWDSSGAGSYGYSTNYNSSSTSGYLYNSAGKRVNDNNLTNKTSVSTIERNISSTYSTDTAMAYLQTGDVDSALREYKSVLDDAYGSVADYGYELSDTQTKSIAQDSVGHSNFLNAVSENTNGSYITGLLQGIPLYGFFAEKTSTADAIAELNGTETSATNKAKEFCGRLTVPAVLAAAAFIPGIGTVATAGLAIAAGVGALSGLCKSGKANTAS